MDPRISSLAAWIPRTSSLVGHRDAVADLAFSPDSEYLVSAAHDNTIRIWRSRGASPPEAPPALSPSGVLRTDDSRTALKTLAGHGSSVASVRVLRGGSDGAAEVISGSYDQTVRLWRIDDYRPVRTFAEPDSAPVAASDVDVSNDGRLLAVASVDGVARLFDAASGDLIGKLDEGHRFLTYAAHYFREGRRLLTISGDNTTRIWDSRTGGELRRLDGTGYRGVAAISHDEKMIATGSRDKTALLWPADNATPPRELLRSQVEAARQDAATFAPLPGESERQRQARLERHVPDVTAMAFSSDDELLAIGDSVGNCRLCDSASGAIVADLQAHEKSISNLAFISDDDGEILLTASGDTTVAAWRVIRESGQASLVPVAGKRLQHPGRVIVMDTHRDASGQWLLYTVSPQRASADPEDPATVMQLRRWRWGMPEPDETIDVDVERINSLDVVEVDEQPLVLMACVDKAKTFLMQWSGGAEADPLWPDGAQRGLVSSGRFSQDLQTVLAIGGRGARAWDRGQGLKLLSFRPHGELTGVRFLPPGFRVQKAADGLPQLQAVEPGGPAGDTLLVTSSTDGALKIWRVAEDGAAEAIWRLEGAPQEDPLRRGHTGAIRHCDFRRDGDILTLLTASDDGTAKLWRLGPSRLWRVERTFVASGPVSQALFSPAGDHVVTVGQGDAGLIWKVDQESQPVARLDTAAAAVQGAIRCVAFSSDSQWLATGGDDFVVRIWAWTPDEPLCKLRARMAGHSQAVTGVAFSLDGQRLLSSSADNLCQVWNTRPLYRAADDPQDFEVMLTLKGHSGPVTSAAFAAGGATVVTSSADGSCRLWDSVAVPPAIHLGRARVPYTMTEGAEPPRVRVAARAIVSEPTRADFSGHRLIARLIDAKSSGERLLVLHGESAQPGGLIRDGDQLRYFRQADGQAVEVGRLDDSTPATLTIHLDANVTSEALQQTLRRTAYQHPGKLDAATSRVVEFELRDAEGRLVGNHQDAPEQQVIELRSK